MSDLKSVIIMGDGPVKNGAALHGADIGYIYGGYNVQLTVDLAQLHDGWVPITNPATWRDTGQIGWVKWSRCAVDEDDCVKLLVTHYFDGRAPIVKVVK